jgi:hypothetical protein
MLEGMNVILYCKHRRYNAIKYLDNATLNIYNPRILGTRAGFLPVEGLKEAGRNEQDYRN